MVRISDMQAGKAGEYLVCADLILQGHVAYPSEQALSYDVVVDVDGRLIRLQVKTTRGMKETPQRVNPTLAYLFQIRRMGKAGRRDYTAAEVDMFALVALDQRVIGYMAEVDARRSMVFRVRGQEYYEQKKSEARDEVAKLRAEGLSFTEVSERLGIHRGTAFQRTRPHEEKTYGRYLEDFSFTNALARLQDNP